MRPSCAVDDTRRRQLIEDGLHRYAGVSETDGAQCPRPHEQAALAEQPFVEDRRVIRRKFPAVNGQVLDAVYAEIQGLFRIAVSTEGDEVK